MGDRSRQRGRRKGPEVDNVGDERVTEVDNVGDESRLRGRRKRPEVDNVERRNERGQK